MNFFYSIKEIFSGEIKFFHSRGKVLLRCALGLLLIIWLSTIFGQVKVNETGVLLRFGKVQRRNISAGICFKLPWPVDSLKKIGTKEVRRMRAGFGADPAVVKTYQEQYGGFDTLDNPSLLVPYVILGDKNILHIKVVVAYRVADPGSYLFEVQKPEDIIRRLIQNAIISVLAESRVDDVLTTGKIALKRAVYERVTQDPFTAMVGIKILSLEIKNVRPPGKTAESFKEVINAQEERTESVHNSLAYKKSVIPRAKAEATRIREAAKAEKNTLILDARGRAESFMLLAEEYQKEPEIVRERLRLETVKEVLQMVRKVINSDADTPVRVKIMQ